MRERLRTHRQKHEAKFACDLCGKRFQARLSLFVYSAPAHSHLLLLHLRLGFT